MKLVLDRGANIEAALHQSGLHPYLSVEQVRAGDIFRQNQLHPQVLSEAEAAERRVQNILGNTQSIAEVDESAWKSWLVLQKRYQSWIKKSDTIDITIAKIQSALTEKERTLSQDITDRKTSPSKNRSACHLYSLKNT